MSLYVDIGQGVGLSGATGVRPYLPTLLAGGLARGDIGIDFDQCGGWEFLEAPGFLLAVFALALLSYGAERSALNQSGGTTGAADEEAGAPARTPGGLRRVVGFAEGVIGVVLGALLFAGSLAAGGWEAWPGFLAGAACAALAWVAVGGFLDRVRRRLEGGALGMLTLYAEAAALVLALVAVVVPVIAPVAVVAFLVLLVTRRREEGRKYAGLRVLR